MSENTPRVSVSRPVVPAASQRGRDCESHIPSIVAIKQTEMF